MDKTELALFTVIFVDTIIVFALVMLFIGYSKKKIFSMGRWYYKSAEKNQFWQVTIGYVLLIIVLFYIRLFVFPEKLFQYFG